MIALSQAVDLLLGDPDDPPRRAMILGAGFAKACAPWSPLFNDYKWPLVELLRAHGDPFARTIEPGDDLKWVEVTELIERVDRVLGRVALARLILAEPHGAMGLYPARDHHERPLPPGLPRTYPTLADWIRQIHLHNPTHLEPLAPDAPNVLLGRLLAEGVIDELLSTNWDALVELGAMLAGLRIEDADEPDQREAWWAALPGRLRVFERQDDLVGRWPLHGQPALYKLHGGVRTLYRVLAQGPTEAREQELRRSFLLSSSDLTRWRGASQWVEEKVPSVLRACATLFLGVSGADPVTFHACRAQIGDWEDTATRAFAEGRPSRPLRLAAVDRFPGLRLRNMLTALTPHRELIENVATSAAQRALYAVSAHHQLRLLTAMAPGLATAAHRVANVVSAEMDASLDAPLGPISQLVVQSVAWGARWTAEALGAGPFAVRAPESQTVRRWWYAPWRDAPPTPLRAASESIIRWLDGLSRCSDRIEIDPWTGAALVHGPSPRVLLPLPCPWTEAFDWSGDALARALAPDRLGWGTGHGLETLSRAPIELVPLGGGRPTGPPPRVANLSTHWSAP